MMSSLRLSRALGAVLACGVLQVLAQAPSSSSSATNSPRPTWSHLLTVTTPEASNFTSVSFGYQVAYGEVFVVGAHVGPSFRPEGTSAFAPLIWGNVTGMSILGAKDLGDGSSLGGYLRVDRTRSGFSYQGFRQNPQTPDPNVFIAGPMQEASFKQIMAEVGMVARVGWGARWVVQGEAGVAGGRRGMFTPSDIYPGYDSRFTFFDSNLREYNEYRSVWGIRTRVMVAYRIGQFR